MRPRQSTLPPAFFGATLVDAARRGDLGAMRAALAEWNGPAPRLQEALDAALAEAAREGQATCAGYLLDQGASPRRRHGAAPLYLAAERGHADAIGVLLDRTTNAATELAEALARAIAGSRVEAAAFLLDRGAPLERRCFAIAARQATLEPLLLLLERSEPAAPGQFDEALASAVAHGRTDAASLLLKLGASAQGAVASAAAGGSVAFLELLEKHGADLLADGDNALRLAAKEGRFDAVEFLLARGADPMAVDGSAIAWARAEGHEDVAALLERAAGIEPEESPMALLARGSARRTRARGPRKGGKRLRRRARRRS